jgi:hypothetical protein
VLNQRIVPIVADILQFPEPQERMDDQLQKDSTRMKDLLGPQGLEAATQLAFEIDAGEELLKDHEPGEGRQGLVLEAELGQGMGFTVDFGAAILHGDLLVLCLGW